MASKILSEVFWTILEVFQALHVPHFSDKSAHALVSFKATFLISPLVPQIQFFDFLQLDRTFGADFCRGTAFTI